MHRVFIAIGSNLGRSNAIVQESIRRIDADTRMKVIRVSSFYETEAVSPTPQKNFINGAIEISTSCDPHELLHALQGIEVDLGRENKGDGSPRTLDLDILLFESLILSDPTGNLILPHPRLHERRFVLEPLSEIAGEVVHPVMKKSITSLKQNLQDCHWVRKVEGESTGV